MIKIKLQLFSILREKLPADAKGRAEMRFKTGATLDELLDELDIKRKVTISVNGIQETDKSRILCDGDEVSIFSAVSGG
jgi:molybdopterin converting factor small subunit